MFNPERLSMIIEGVETRIYDLDQQYIARMSSQMIEEMLAGLGNYYNYYSMLQDRIKLIEYRSSVVDLIFELSGDEYDYDGLKGIATTTDYDLIDTLRSAIEYIKEYEEEYR